MPSGIIIKGIGGFYYVKTEAGTYECKARGIFRKTDVTPLPGDMVEISILDEETMKGSMDAILPRKSLLVRPAVANVNQIALVLAAKSPAPDFMLLDKLLITAEIKGIEPIICVNKIDLDEEEEYRKKTDGYKHAGYRIIPMSPKAGAGLEKLRQILTGHITVFAGQSGVGKSTILNRIMDSWVMKTGDVSGKIERGKHTTRHAELLELQDGGYVVDTPGFSSFELTDIEHDTLELYYPEFRQYLNKCRFTGCSHINEPDCCVKEALEKGLIDKDRYNRYIQFYNMLKENKTYKNKRK